nr:hypothetical protein [Tanacetum cinerariifolium]
MAVPMLSMLLESHSLSNRTTVLILRTLMNVVASVVKLPCVSKTNFVDKSSNIFNPPPQPTIYSCEFCESNAQYGHYCTPQAPFINLEPGYSQDFNFSQDIHNFQQQYICCDQCGGPHETCQCQQVISCEPCCENCGGPHENFQCQPLNYCEPSPTYDSNYSGFDQFGDLHLQQDLCFDNCRGPHETSQCQPINQNFYNSNSSGFDQTQSPQFPVIHPPPQETSIEISHDQENVINSVQTFLRKFNRYSFFEMPKVLLLAWDRVSEIKVAFENNQYKPEDIQELFHVYDDDDDDVDYTIAITPVLSTEEPDNSLSMGDEHIDTLPVMESDDVIKSSVEDLVPIPSEFKGIPDTIYDESLYYENIEYVEASPHDSELVSLEVNLLIAEIEALKDNHTPSSEFLTKSPSTSPKPFLEGTNTFHNSLPEFENFCFNLEEISSGSTTTPFDISLSEYEAFYFYDNHIEEIRSDSTTTHSDISLPDYEAFSFYDNYIKEIRSDSTTTHSDISLPDYEAFSFYDNYIKEIRSDSTTTQSDISLPEYDLFIFDLSNDQFPPTDGSDFTHEEFDDEFAHIISPPEYDCFYFGNFLEPGELISSLNSGIRDNLSSTTCVNLPVEDDYFPLLAYVVWIFFAYLTYPVIPPHLHSFGNEDTIFDPGITINRSYLSKLGLSHRCGTFKEFNTHRSHLNESPMEMLSIRKGSRRTKNDSVKLEACAKQGLFGNPKSSHVQLSNRFKHDLPFKPRWGNDPGKLRATPDLLIRDCSCSKGSVEDKILVPKPPENCARCGHPFNGPYCQGCTLLLEKLKEDPVTYFQKFQNTSESSDGSTNVVNAPREPFVVKQDHGVNPPHINECCCECGEMLDGIICQRCACKSCGKGAHIGYNCPPKVPIISNPEPCNQTMNNEPPQTLPSLDSTCYSDKEFQYLGFQNLTLLMNLPIFSTHLHNL